VKESFYFVEEHLVVINNAMSEYRGSLKGIQKRLFDISFNKIINTLNGHTELDGMEMEYIILSLRKQGLKFHKLKMVREASFNFSLALWIEAKKKGFQKSNGPQIKTATSDGTLVAAVV
jgi:radical SAM superfamily enzyme